MPDPLLSEPFLQRPPPRCLIARDPRSGIHEVRETPRMRPARWPLRASFERWGLRLLQIRSGRGH